MNILVTGAAGQLGKTIARVSRDSANRYLFCSSRELDITDECAVERYVVENSVNVVVNCASYTAVDKAEDDAEAADRVNHKAVASLARIAKEHDLVLIHISTDYVFNGCSGLPYGDEAQTDPLNVYGRTKADGEKAIEASDCRYIILRTSWLYGSEGDNFVKRILQKSAEIPVLRVISDQIGSPTYADDLAYLIFCIIEEDMLDRTGIYNYSNEGVCSWYDFAHEICRMSGNLCEVFPCRTEDYPRKAARPHFSLLDKTKVKETFGIDIPHWKDSLRICMDILNDV